MHLQERQTNNQSKQKQHKMKTTEKNTAEVMTYLEKSSQHFFESEDGKHWQAVVKLQASGDYIFIRDGEVFPIDVSKYINNNLAGKPITEGKTFLKYKLHPCWDVSHSFSTKDYGHGPSKKLSAVRWNKAKLELTSTATQNYLQTLQVEN